MFLNQLFNKLFHELNQILDCEQTDLIFLRRKIKSENTINNNKISHAAFIASLSVRSVMETLKFGQSLLNFANLLNFWDLVKISYKCDYEKLKYRKHNSGQNCFNLFQFQILQK